MRILLVDDEQDLVSALAERLSFRGIEAHWATSAQQALEMAGETDYEMAVLDVKMPRMSGIELRERLSEMHPDMRFVFVTGHGSEEDYRAGMHHGDCYLIKPVRLEDLLEAINKPSQCPTQKGM